MGSRPVLSQNRVLVLIDLLSLALRAAGKASFEQNNSPRRSPPRRQANLGPTPQPRPYSAVRGIRLAGDRPDLFLSTLHLRLTIAVQPSVRVDRVLALQCRVGVVDRAQLLPDRLAVADGGIRAPLCLRTQQCLLSDNGVLAVDENARRHRVRHSCRADGDRLRHQAQPAISDSVSPLCPQDQS
jgi:hypothetical protein